MTLETSHYTLWKLPGVVESIAAHCDTSGGSQLTVATVGILDAMLLKSEVDGSHHGCPPLPKTSSEVLKKKMTLLS